MTSESLKQLRAREIGKLANRKWLRVRAQRLLHSGRSIQEVADGLGTHPRAIRRVRDGYLSAGLKGALEDVPKTKSSQAEAE